MKDSFVVESFDSPSKNSIKQYDEQYYLKEAKQQSKSRRALQSGADRIARTFRRISKTFGNISKRLRLGGRRRHRLVEEDSPCKDPSPVPNIDEEIDEESTLEHDTIDEVPTLRHDTMDEVPTLFLGRGPHFYLPFDDEIPIKREDRRKPACMPGSPDGDIPKRRMPGRPTHACEIFGIKKPVAMFF